MSYYQNRATTLSNPNKSTIRLINDLVHCTGYLILISIDQYKQYYYIINNQYIGYPCLLYFTKKGTYYVHCTQQKKSNTLSNLITAIFHRIILYRTLNYILHGFSTVS